MPVLEEGMGPVKNFRPAYPVATRMPGEEVSRSRVRDEKLSYTKKSVWHNIEKGEPSQRRIVVKNGAKSSLGKRTAERQKAVVGCGGWGKRFQKKKCDKSLREKKRKPVEKPAGGGRAFIRFGK